MPGKYLGALLAVSALVATLAAETPSAKPVLRADSSLVLIGAHVTTAQGASVTSLQKDNFQLIEDNVGQTIAHFAQDDAPVSVGILFDVSRSMTRKMQTASQALAAFFQTANPADEFFLIEFSSKARLAVPFTTDSDYIHQQVAGARPGGQTALLDAVHLALGRMKQAQYPRRALVIFSDGGDNMSRHGALEVKRELLESDVQVFAMGIFDVDDAKMPTYEERNGPKLLDALANQSGGRHYRVRNLNDLPAVSAAIGNELRTEYLLGYYPTNSIRDGKYRQVKVRLVATPAPDLHLYYRRGYYSPLE